MHRHQQQRDEGRQREAADLRVAERLPERSAVHRERDQAEHGRADRDQHRPQAQDAGVEQRLAQRLAPLVPLLDEVEEHDDVADDHADQADDAEERHEAERLRP